MENTALAVQFCILLQAVLLRFRLSCDRFSVGTVTFRSGGACSIMGRKFLVTLAALDRLFWIFLGGLCYYAALPPLYLAPLALAVPICWGIVIRHQTAADVSKLSCRLPFAVYLAAFFFWLASIWWIACPHPLTSLGLLALSAYLSLYWLLFFVSARVAVHRFRVPLFIAMPVCWIGCEYLRCHLLGGFSFCALEHAFYLYPPIIQWASIGGSSLVGGIIMFLGAALITLLAMCRHFVPAFFIIPFLFGLFLVPTIPFFQTLVHGVRSELNDNKTEFSFVVLQGNRQVSLNSQPEEAETTFRQFVDLTYQEIHDRKQKGTPLPDLIVFPETVCPIPLLSFEGTITPDDLGWTEEDAAYWEREFRHFAQNIETPILLGLSTYVFKDSPEPARLNSALLVSPQYSDEPSKLYRYDKMHLVMFGEYIPFSEYLPDNFILTSLCVEAQSGTNPVAFPIGQGSQKTADGRQQSIQAVVNICFESSVSHLIRNQILTLRKEGHDPRLLINISNDGWFRFSQEIEQHLATHIFRAVENRMYYVTAANGGFSAIISPYGEILKIGKHGAAEAVSGTVSVNLNEAPPQTIYQQFGDGYALPFAFAVVVLTIFAFVERRKGRGGKEFEVRI